MKEGIIMKKLMTLALAAAMMLGATTGANAIDFKAKGQWIMSFDYGMHGNFSKNKAATNSGYRSNSQNEDQFEAMQRVRLQLDAVLLKPCPVPCSLKSVKRSGAIMVPAVTWALTTTPL